MKCFRPLQTFHEG